LKYPDILSVQPRPAEFAYDEDFTILYALGLGAGGVPEDLRFVYEKELRAIPTMAVMMAQTSGEFLERGGIDYTGIVHGEQRLRIHRPLPPAGRMVSTSRCLSVIDKGAAKGALLNVESTVSDAATGALHATTVMTLFCRKDGGFGGPGDGDLPVHPIPGRAPDLELELPTLPQQAQLYRLLGDRNPLHIDPEVAKRAGFDRPILHGLCTYGIACRAIMKACCDNDPDRIEQIDIRCSSPVFPGEPITTLMWRDGQRISFECVAAQRGATVIRNGLCVLRS